MLKPPTWLEFLRLRQAFKRGQWQPSLLLQASQLANEHPQQDCLLLYANIRQALSGFDKESILQLEKTSQQHKKYTNSALHCRILALKAEHKILEKSELEGLAAASRLSRYPRLLERMPSRDIIGGKMHPLKILADDLHKRCSTLENFLKLHPPAGSYCVVGNAPTEKGKSQQSCIDSCDAVFRFNRVHTSTEHQAAYGSRTDAWVVSPSFSLNGQTRVSDQVFISGVSVFDRPSHYWQRLAKHDNINFYTFPAAVWYELVAKLNAPPTAGLLCIASLRKYLQPTATLKVFGISRSENGPVNHYGDKGKRSGRHNWDLEVTLVNELLQTQFPR